MNVLLFGTGKFYQYYRICFNQVNIIGLLDNDEKKQGMYQDGVKIYIPEAVADLTYDQIYLLSAKTGEMRRQLLSLGVQPECIFEVYDLYRGLGNLITVRPMKIYAPDGSDRAVVGREAAGCIVIFTPNLSLNGAEVALCQLVRTLEALGHKVLVASLYDGSLRYELQEMNVSVIVLGRSVHEVPLSSLKFLDGAQGIILNTIEMYLLLQKRSKYCKIFWWLHDSDFIYSSENIKDNLLRQIDLKYVTIQAVSDVAREAFEHHYGKKTPIKIMPYGLKDWAESVKLIKKIKAVDSGILKFVLVGALSDRKAQDILIEAVCKMPAKIRKQCKFFLVGDGLDGEVGTQLRLMSDDLPEIVFKGEMSREEVLRFYAENMDVLICPSRDDSLPIVTVEAMMFGKPVIVSRAVGTYKLLENEGGGIVVATENADELAQAICRLFDNPDERRVMGRNARCIYEKNFTLDIFKKQVQQLLTDMKINPVNMN